MTNKWFTRLTAAVVAFGTIVPGTGLAAEAGAVNSTSGSVQQSSFQDTNGHWAEKAIQEFAAGKKVKGYSDGTFKPDQAMTRAELVTTINNVFGYDQAAEFAFSDVQPTDWFYKEIGKASSIGYISGYEDGSFRANHLITRQETAVLMDKLLSLPASNTAAAYNDTANSPAWSTDAIGAVIDASIITGYEGNVFRPEANVTRAEAVTILQRALDAATVTYDTAGQYGPESGVEQIYGNVEVNAADITLQNVEIHGDLLLGEGIGEGDVTLKNVKVHGTTTVKGGGENSIHFEDSIMVTVIVNKATGKVRIVANGATQIADVTVESNAKIEAETGSVINNVTMSEALPENSKVELVGSFETVNVVAQSVVVEIPKGSVKDMKVDKKSAGSKINVGSEAAIISLIVNAAADILGQGKIGNATVNAAGIKMEKAPEKTTLGADVSSDTTVTIGDKETNVTTTPAAGGGGTTSGGTSSGSSGGSDDSDDSSDPVNVYPLPTGEVPSILHVTYHTATVGDSVYVSSNMGGWIYIAESGTTRTYPVLEEAVRGGKAVKQQLSVVDNVYGTNVNTTGLSKTALEYIIVAVSNGYQASNPEYLILLAGAADPMQYIHSAYTPQDNQMIAFKFNKKLVNNLADTAALKAAISFAADGVNFQPLAAGDTVTIRSNSIEVDFATPYTGKLNTLKLAANALKDEQGNVFSQEVVSDPIEAGALVTKMSYASSFTAGEEIAVRVNQAETIYLVLASLSPNILYDLENEVVAKRGVKVTADETQIDVDINISTAGLAPGEYMIRLWTGNSIPVTIK
ncbi:S-layer homology domain-containing protein [Paenibacillus turpanensis]|uniref:S-layer homology domain-containing protein n=1 Tax=Paenibacillus turpanensis TaxID=2689078 RepID=UPI001407B4B0|nr:S-layer homology domain-containing protein [Paenibacillus turpanensis]